MNTLQIQDSFEPYYADRNEPAYKPAPKVREQTEQRKVLDRLKDKLRKSDDKT